MNVLLALLRKDLVLWFSNKRSLLIGIAAPIAIAAFFGSLFGVTTDGKRARIPIAVIDDDGSAVSKRIVAALNAHGTLSVEPLDAGQADDALRRGKLRAVVTLPPRFGDDAPRALLGGRDRPAIGIRYDPSQGFALQVVQGLLTQYVMEAVMGSALAGADATRESRVDAATPAPTVGAGTKPLAPSDGGRGSAAPVAFGERPAGGGAAFAMPYTVVATESRSSAGNANYGSYAHAFAGMGVQFILLMGVDLGIKLLTTRRLGLWQRLRAAPLSRGLLLGSQIASGSVIAALVFAIIFAAGIVAFGVRIDGSVVGFVALIVAFAVMTASFGLFIAALGRTPEATRGLAIFATLLMVMLGGAWIPAFIFPQWLQTASLSMPTRWAVDGFDAMTWRGLGLDAAWQPVLVLLGFALVFAMVAVARFDWDEKPS